MAYLPIEQYGVIGDMRSAALVGTNGSIDWWCTPDFDSPSVFAAILDDRKGGRFRIGPERPGAVPKQMYFPDTNVLLTRFLTPDGVGELCDFMAVPGPAVGHRLVRRLTVVRGTLAFEVRCEPAFDYARSKHRTEIRAEGALFHGPGLSLALSTTVPLREDGAAAVGRVVLEAGRTATFVLADGAEHADCLECLTEDQGEAAFRATVDFWRRWIGRSKYRGRWREMVNRSALVLKLLTYEPTGAIVAAPTTSLPEWIGGKRNWDYRYSWIRDASFTLYGLMRIGFTDEARAFMGWLSKRVHEPNEDGSLQIVYSIGGKHDLEERTLDHLEGYRGSAPVRIGNAAHRQLQLDVYGELMDAVYLFNKHGEPISYELWVHLRRMLNWVADHWGQPDEGIWEVRGGRRHFVYSKVMCWVALDRGLRLAEKRSFPADRDRWLRARDAIYEEVMSKGWSRERQSFVQAYDSSTLDASNLIMPLVFFLSPTDPRMKATLEAVSRELRSGSLVLRYNPEASPDGLEDREGAFTMCSFWLVEALTRAGELDEARLLLEKMFGFANHLGLYSEEIGPSGEALGNFPQAFTHLSLISAAFNLDRALEGRA